MLSETKIDIFCKDMQDLAFDAKLDISQEPAKLNFHVTFGRVLIRSWKNNQVLETHAKILLFFAHFMLSC